MKEKNKLPTVEHIAMRATEWIGSIGSLLIHSLLFLGAFVFVVFGYSLEKILLVLTTLVSLEAIYLAIFIQMTVNRNTESLEEVEEDIGEIQKDVDEIQEDVDEIQKDVDEIQEDVDEVVEDVKEDDAESAATKQAMEKITADLQRLLKDVEALQNRQK
jgi:peptidoglycan hydrolase CwlO-like protein